MERVAGGGSTGCGADSWELETSAAGSGEATEHLFDVLFLRALVPGFGCIHLRLLRFNCDVALFGGIVNKAEQQAMHLLRLRRVGVERLPQFIPNRYQWIHSSRLDVNFRSG